MADPELEKRVRELMTEITTTARELGHSIRFELIHDMIDRTRTMTQYRPSSLIDFEEEREVEIEPIWGEPLRKDEAAGLAMPGLSQLYQNLQAFVSAL